MIKKYSFFTCLFFLLGFSLCLAQSRSDTRVAKIDVVIQKAEMSDAVSASIVKSKMKTKEGGVFSQTEFDNDLKELSKEYDRIDPVLQFESNQVFITLNIWTKSLIHSISFQGNEHIKDKRLQKELGIYAGQVFERSAFIEAFQKLKSYYVKQGYFESELDWQAELASDGSGLDIIICIQEGRSGKIKKLCFEGFTREEEKCLLEMVQTKKYQFLTSWMNQTGIYHQELLEHDRMIITDFLQNEGYADANVAIKVEPSEREENRILIIISADKGQMYTFGSLTIEGNTVFSSEQIQHYFRICQGAPFSPDGLRATVQAITKLYGSWGYIESSVHFMPRLSTDQAVYDVDFEIHEGEQYRVGLVKVYGNSHTEASVILHECLLVPGEVFDARRLQATEERLQNIQYFKNVNVYPVKSADEKLLGSNYRDVHIEVEEDSTGNLSAFFGFSTLDSLFGGVELMERNFRYKGLFDIFKDGPSALRGGGEYLQLKAMLGTKSTSYLLHWVKPYFRDTNWVVGFDAEKAQNSMVSSDYKIETSGGKLHATYPVNAYVSFGWYYRLRYSKVHLDQAASENPLINEEAKRSGWISATGLNLSYSRINNLYKTTDGLRSELNFEFSGLGGHYKFLSMSYINTLYVPVTRKSTLKFRGDLRFIQTLPSSVQASYTENGQEYVLSRADSLPLSERFFMGGETSVRGYEGFSIGPKFPNGDPQGGISSALLSEEYSYSLTKRISAFVFTDAGTVSSKAFHINKLRASCGYGLRVELFNQIPIIFGMGYPINPESQSDVRRFFVSLGGRF